jgi:aspartyl/asparaginyl beta-hydroxylase (cupin superfamily)
MQMKQRVIPLLLLGLVVIVMALLWKIVECKDGFRLLAWVNTLCKREVEHNPYRLAFHPTDQLDWCATLRNHYKHIRHEFRMANTTAPIFSEILPEQWNLSDKGALGKWRVVVLRIYGRDTDVQGFPLTRSLLHVIPGCTTAMFSILEPGRELVTHRGPNHGILRYHLALEVPSDATKCTLTVNNDIRHWYEGHDLLFDDTLPHSAKNLSYEVRVVLFLDILRPLSNTWRSYMNAGFHWLIAPNTKHIRSAVARINECANATPTTLYPTQKFDHDDTNKMIHTVIG